MTTPSSERVSTEQQDLASVDGRPHARLFDEPPTVKLSLEAGDAVAPHQHPDRVVVLHVLEGRLSVTLGEDEREVRAGEVVRFDGAQDISPEALETTTALLVLASREG
ncbi:cupin domain-containing protein [Natrialbaceae archaeon GCM10025810]|uniref:cupin domain-containing protein n=1 Tax=Halovalidus salilacus TaxID=3075124 RepID=UPI0036106017